MNYRNWIPGLMLGKRREELGEDHAPYETLRSQEGGVYNIIFRWRDGEISKNVEGMFRRDEDAIANQFKLHVLIHAWRNEVRAGGERATDGLHPTRIATLPRPIDEKSLQHVLSVAYAHVSSWNSAALQHK